MLKKLWITYTTRLLNLCTLYDNRYDSCLLGFFENVSLTTVGQVFKGPWALRVGPIWLTYSNATPNERGEEDSVPRHKLMVVEGIDDGQISLDCNFEGSNDGGRWDSGEETLFEGTTPWDPTFDPEKDQSLFHQLELTNNLWQWLTTITTPTTVRDEDEERGSVPLSLGHWGTAEGKVPALWYEEVHENRGQEEDNTECVRNQEVRQESGNRQRRHIISF